MKRCSGFLLAATAVAISLSACGYSGSDQAVAVCNQLDENQVTAPDQIARRVYGDGQFSAAAAGIRATCPEEHGAVAVYLDDTANYDGTYELKAPPGYGTSMF